MEKSTLPSSEEVSSSDEPEETTSSAEVTSEESSTIEESSSEESLEPSVESSEAESSEEPVLEDWTLTSEDIPETSQGKYNTEFDFSCENASFHGSYLQRGTGSKNKVSLNGTIQIRKNDEGVYGYFYLKEGKATHLEFAILRIHSVYQGEGDPGPVDHDFTGVPTLYSYEPGKEAEATTVQLTKEEKQDGEGRDVYLYSVDLPNPGFRFENLSNNAIYLEYISCFDAIE